MLTHYRVNDTYRLHRILKQVNNCVLRALCLQDTGKRREDELEALKNKLEQINAELERMEMDIKRYSTNTGRVRCGSAEKYSGVVLKSCTLETYQLMVMLSVVRWY